MSDTFGSMYVGVEMEKTPASGLMTVFVDGYPESNTTDPVDTIREYARYNDCSHIRLGYNNSYQPDMTYYDIVKGLIKAGFIVSLEFDASHWEYVLEEFADHEPNFIPIVSVKLPYNSMANYNTVIKIDDKPGGGTTDGTWCHYLHDLRDRTKFNRQCNISGD